VLEVYRSYTFRHLHRSGRTPPIERSARYRGRYVHKTNKCKSRTSMPLAGFEPAIPAVKRLQTYALKRKATGIDLAL
jgi:hypothetical protein